MDNDKPTTISGTCGQHLDEYPELEDWVTAGGGKGETLLIAGTVFVIFCLPALVVGFLLGAWIF